MNILRTGTYLLEYENVVFLCLLYVWFFFKPRYPTFGHGYLKSDT